MALGSRTAPGDDPRATTGRLRDAHGPAITDLRVSVTDRCNFRCRYCMPGEGMPWLDRVEILSFEEIERTLFEGSTNVGRPDR